MECVKPTQSSSGTSGGKKQRFHVLVPSNELNEVLSFFELK